MKNIATNKISIHPGKVSLNGIIRLGLLRSVNEILTDCECTSCRQLGAQQNCTSHQYIQISGERLC